MVPGCWLRWSSRTGGKDVAMEGSERRQQAADLYRDDRIGRRDALRGGLSEYECEAVMQSR